MSSKGRTWSESAFTRWFCRCIEKVNGKTVALVGSNMQKAGIPDRFISHKSLPGGMWLEFKKDDGRVSDAQRLFLREHSERGTTALVIRWRASGHLTVESYAGVTLGYLDTRALTNGSESAAGVLLIGFLKTTMS